MFILNTVVSLSNHWPPSEKTSQITAPSQWVNPVNVVLLYHCKLENYSKIKKIDVKTLKFNCLRHIISIKMELRQNLTRNY